MEDILFACIGCGNKLNSANSENGVVECECCLEKRVVPQNTINNDARAFITQGDTLLLSGDFDKAYQAYARAAECAPEEATAYFGMALAEFKVQYLKDEVKGRMQPICFSTYDARLKSFKDNINYIKAIKNTNQAQRQVYEKNAEEIDYINNAFAEIEKTGLDYDCFICVKVSEEDEKKNKTADYKIADDLYFELKKKGFKPFFSEREIVDQTGADYEAHILHALYSSECMLVVCGNEEYLNTKWVKNEYSRFLKLVRDDQKESDSITIVYNRKPIEKLPGKKGKIQGIDISGLNGLERVISFVEKHTPEAKKRKEEEAARAQLKEKEAAERQKQAFEEMQRNFSAQLNTKFTEVRGKETISEGPTVEALLLRAAQQLEVENFQEAEKIYGQILDSQPENANAWKGQLLCEYNCKNDNNFVQKIQNASPEIKNSYTILLKLRKSQNYKYASKYNTYEISHFITRISSECDERIISLCENALPEYEHFYDDVISAHKDLPREVVAHANFAKFLLQNSFDSYNELNDYIHRYRTDIAREEQEVMGNKAILKEERRLLNLKKSIDADGGDFSCALNNASDELRSELITISRLVKEKCEELHNNLCRERAVIEKELDKCNSEVQKLETMKIQRADYDLDFKNKLSEEERELLSKRDLTQKRKDALYKAVEKKEPLSPEEVQLLKQEEQEYLNLRLQSIQEKEACLDKLSKYNADKMNLPVTVFTYLPGFIKKILAVLLLLAMGFVGYLLFTKCGPFEGVAEIVVLVGVCLVAYAALYSPIYCLCWAIYSLVSYPLRKNKQLVFIKLNRDLKQMEEDIVETEQCLSDYYIDCSADLEEINERLGNSTSKAKAEVDKVQQLLNFIESRIERIENVEKHRYENDDEDDDHDYSQKHGKRKTQARYYDNDSDDDDNEDVNQPTVKTSAKKSEQVDSNDDSAKESQEEFFVKINNFGPTNNKIAVIKVVREATGMGLVEAKSAVERLGVIGGFKTKKQADKFISLLKQAGASASLQ